MHISFWAPVVGKFWSWTPLLTHSEKNLLTLNTCIQYNVMIIISKVSGVPQMFCINSIAQKVLTKVLIQHINTYQYKKNIWVFPCFNKLENKNRDIITNKYMLLQWTPRLWPDCCINKVTIASYQHIYRSSLITPYPDRYTFYASYQI